MAAAWVRAVAGVARAGRTQTKGGYNPLLKMAQHRTIKVTEKSRVKAFKQRIIIRGTLARFPY